MSETAETAAFAYRPLYAQVRENLVRRLIDGAWQPGQLIPSEIDLAKELGVSQGTIRKALDAMTAENLLIRRQGRGTFVSEPEESRILFQFYRLVPDSGARSFPNSRILKRLRETANEVERRELKIAAGGDVIRLERVRTIDEKPMIVETISLSLKRFAGFEDLETVPNNVYRLYSERWGITIGRAGERLKAIAASKADARELGCPQGTPLLEINRVAYDLEGHPVELRLSRCLTDVVHYSSDLR
ncbi:MAG TPA: GntR family transcriptional regulator [Rhizobiaceae bacterium]|nr:GntR family transcriptional regulator [Rhizobiaceae bacterium]